MIFYPSRYLEIENFSEVVFLLLKYCDIDDLYNKNYLVLLPKQFYCYGIDYIDFVEHYKKNKKIIGLVFYVSCFGMKLKFFVEFDFLKMFD